jgi:hypothetical protein
MPDSISEKALGAAWQKILDVASYRRKGRLVGSVMVRAEVAFDATGTGAMVVRMEGMDLFLPENTELWARCEDGGIGPAEVTGQMRPASLP